jgi:hypothetical protein
LMGMMLLATTGGQTGQLLSYHHLILDRENSLRHRAGPLSEMAIGEICDRLTSSYMNTVGAMGLARRRRKMRFFESIPYFSHTSDTVSTLPQIFYDS